MAATTGVSGWLALCQILPGATVVQMAAYTGYRLRRTPGALVAVGGFILSSFVLMTVLSYLYFHYGTLPWVKSISRGLNAMVIALLLQALWRGSWQPVRKKIDHPRRVCLCSGFNVLKG